MAKVKWSDENVAILVETYDKTRSAETVLEAMELLGKTKREVVGKLSSLKQYVPPVKPKAAPKDEGPTKGEIETAMVAAGYDVDGLKGATKMALLRVAKLVGVKLSDVDFDRVVTGTE